jgi:signal transduction histidine kinase
VLGSPELLDRAIENVIRNAIGYTAPDTTVEIRLPHRNNDGLIVEIRLPAAAAATPYISARGEYSFLRILRKYAAFGPFIHLPILLLPPNL